RRSASPGPAQRGRSRRRGPLLLLLQEPVLERDRRRAAHAHLVGREVDLDHVAAHAALALLDLGGALAGEEVAGAVVGRARAARDAVALREMHVALGDQPIGLVALRRADRLALP